MEDTKGEGHAGGEEVEDLRLEVERFKREKEQVRAIVGRIGGIPTFNTLAFNIIFALVIVVCLVVSLLSDGGKLQLGMIEMAVVAVSLKIMYFMHRQARVNHFELWILSSLEWRLDQMKKEIKAGRDTTAP